MSSIVYYSNFCEHSKKLLQVLGKSQLTKEVHFICIDKRIKEADGNTYIVLENGQKIIMPNVINQVPALMLIADNFRVLYGDNIYEHLKPKALQQQQQQQQPQEIRSQSMQPMTSTEFEPECFSFGGSSSSVVSDQYSFIESDTSAKGDGGMNQLHKYVTIDYADSISSVPKDEPLSSNKIPRDLTIEQLEAKRKQEIGGW